MDDGTLVEEIRESMADAWDVNESELPEDISQASYAPWTSFNQMVLLVALEERFGIHLTLDEMMSMTSMAQIVAVLKRRQVGAGVR